MADKRDGELQQLKKEVRYLRDRQEILDCISRYNSGLDRLDEELLAGTYHWDAIDNHGPFVGYVPEFVKFAIEIEGQFLNTHHGITSHRCDIDGDTAHAESYVFWIVSQPDGETLAAGGGRYIDRLERRNGEWRFTVRRLLMDWTFQVPKASWLGVEWDAVKGSRDKNDPSYQRPLQLPPELMQVLAGKEPPVKPEGD